MRAEVMIFSLGFWLGLGVGSTIFIVGGGALAALAAFAGIYLALGGLKFWRIVAKTMPRDRK